MKPKDIKAVIPVAGLGTRLLTATKVQPKEMLPIFAKEGGELCIKPLVQLVFEQLFDFGIREFCFVVGRGKRTIEDHFTPDEDYLKRLWGSGPAPSKAAMASALEKFYDRVGKANLFWVNQPVPLGFGHAVLQAKVFAGDDPFLVHAGDAYVYSRDFGHLRRLERAFEGAECALELRRVPDPRQYGVASGRSSRGTVAIEELVEKPKNPKTNLAITPVYLFRPSIFGSIEGAGRGVGGEIQLTDGISALIRMGKKVVGVELQASESWIDIGNPTSYWEGLSISHENALA
ncbi:MAG TPA: sugar phosphate nucleotidyltransferase [Nitrososphaerales archaeon]|nr:sugar phosphate nucleotidyltransferase [Nitrososphaerales archaeon]